MISLRISRSQTKMENLITLLTSVVSGYCCISTQRRYAGLPPACTIRVNSAVNEARLKVFGKHGFRESHKNGKIPAPFTLLSDHENRGSALWHPISLEPNARHFIDPKAGLRNLSPSNLPFSHRGSFGSEKFHQNKISLDIMCEAVSSCDQKKTHIIALVCRRRNMKEIQDTPHSLKNPVLGFLLTTSKGPSEQSL